MKTFIHGLLVVSLTLFSEAAALADSADSADKYDLLLGKLQELTQEVKDAKERLKTLERENQKLKAELVKSSASDRAVATSPGVSQAATGNFNPEIGLIADITGIATESDEDFEGNDKLSVRELELIIGHDIDPYSRFDSTITLSDFEDPTIEEAYITHWGLPLDIRARLGRVRPKIGKATAVHRDQLETVDYPFVVQDYLGVEGLYRTAVEGNYYLPFSDDTFTEDISFGVMEGGIGEAGTLFGETRRRPSFYSHLRNFWEISDDDNLELGLTYLLGSADEDSSYEVNAFGLDATYVQNLDASERIKLQTEFYFQDRDQAALEVEGHGHVEDGNHEGHEEVLFDRNPFGFYVLGDYRFSDNYGVGTRFDYVEHANLEEGLDNETLGYSGYLTYYQSEFLRFRFQYQHADMPEGRDNRFMLQATAAIGVHKHQHQ